MRVLPSPKVFCRLTLYQISLFNQYWVRLYVIYFWNLAGTQRELVWCVGSKTRPCWIKLSLCFRRLWAFFELFHAVKCPKMFMCFSIYQNLELRTLIWKTAITWSSLAYALHFKVASREIFIKIHWNENCNETSLFSIFRTELSIDK